MVLIETQTAIRDSIRGFAQKEIRPHSADDERMLSNLEAGRIGIAAQCIGMAQAALEIAVGYAKERKSMGGYGYIEAFGLAKIYRDVRVCQIYEGTSDSQRMVIARAL